MPDFANAAKIGFRDVRPAEVAIGGSSLRREVKSHASEYTSMRENFTLQQGRARMRCANEPLAARALVMEMLIGKACGVVA